MITTTMTMHLKTITLTNKIIEIIIPAERFMYPGQKIFLLSAEHNFGRFFFIRLTHAELPAFPFI